MSRADGPSERKRYTHGTHRACDPEETLARVTPMMPALGITRLANVTGLDTVGVPVYVACRPNSRSLSVSQGKGLTAAAAKASALMESVEAWHAETVRPPLLEASYESIAADGAVDVDGLPFCVASGFRDDLPITWARGDNLLDAEPRWVPFELVHTDYTLPAADPVACFAATTNGLAAGNHRVEAECHALCEVIERDAATLWQLSDAEARATTGLDLTSVDDPDCARLLAALAAAGLRVLVWDIRSDVDVATFYCLVTDEGPGSIPEFGAGCHPSRGIALLRALTEAVQARTTFITGSRDDFASEWYEPVARARRRMHCEALVEGHLAERRFDACPDHGSDLLRDDLDWVLSRLRAVGVREAVSVDLTHPDLGVPVVRAVVSGLEGPYKGLASDYVPGRRALTLMGESA